MNSETEINKLVLYIDGSSKGNPGPAGIGATISTADGGELVRISEYIGETTNNVAEYTALIRTIQTALQYQVDSVEIYSDSELLVNQLNKSYHVKNANLKNLYQRATSLLSGFKDVKIFYISREENKRADELARKSIKRFFKG